jgi:hypothetical protein
MLLILTTAYLRLVRPRTKNRCVSPTLERGCILPVARLKCDMVIQVLHDMMKLEVKLS